MKNSEKTETGEENSAGRIGETIEQAVLGTEGVSRMVPRLTQTIAGSIAKSQNHETGMRFSETGGKLAVDLYLSVQYGFNIPEVSWEVQSHVQQACLRELGIQFHEINIHVQGVDMTGPSADGNEVSEKRNAEIG